MSELRETVRRAADRYRPPTDWLERVNDRVRARRRNRRLVAGIVGLGIPIVLLAALLVNLTSSGDSAPAVKPPAERQCQGEPLPKPTEYWSADGSPTDAISGIEAILRGGASFGPGIVGNAFALDGKDDFIEVPDSRSPRLGAQNFTISFWVRFSSTQGEQVLMEDWIETKALSGPKGWTLTKLRNNAIGFGSDAGGVGANQPDLPVNTWIHIAVRRANGPLSLFVDGQMVANNAMDYSKEAIDSTASLKFGHRGSPDDTPGSRDHRGFFLNGSIDEIALYVGDRLSNAEIQRIFETRGACLP
jgi:concanavalin A-like lectin/glucanase superfamily protein